MTPIPESGPSTEVDLAPSVRPAPSPRADLKTVAYWLSLGAAAGGLGGLLVGGVGGRLAMFVLRLTSDDSVRGIESDDGFTIGRFDLPSTLSLLAVTTVLGAIVGLIVVFGRPFFPKRGMPFAWALAGAITGGGILIHSDGVDFTLLEPHLLAIVFFVAIPAIGAGLIAWLTEVYPKFWWRKRAPTVLACIAAVPIVIFFPIAIFAILVGSIWFLAMQWPRARNAPAWKPARVTAIAAFAFIVALGLLDLTSDVRTIL
ncbi:MAG: hypothetical protein ABI939_00585 [Anaerolineaceae bacterium]